jgi:DNA adenine methylase
LNVAEDAPKRPALRYYGGKWKLAPWIISHFPEHKNYVEPCGGAASVLLRKPRSKLETYNDLDGNVVNFFQVLRDQPDELIRKIKLTPWARAEKELSIQPSSDPVEKARRFFVSMWQGMQGGHYAKEGNTWRVQHHCDSRGNYDLLHLQEENLIKVASRFLDMQIENQPAQDVIKRYDNTDTLIYFDPPYLKETRSHRNTYRLETDNAFHIEAAELLRNAKGYVIVSGYACPLYTELYENHGWERKDKEAQTNSGGKRIESLWLSPRTSEALKEN